MPLLRRAGALALAAAACVPALVVAAPALAAGDRTSNRAVGLTRGPRARIDDLRAVYRRAAIHAGAGVRTVTHGDPR